MGWYSRLSISQIYARRENRAEQWAQRQSAIAELGTYALHHTDASDVCDLAAQIVCQTLKSDLCSLFVTQDKNSEALLLQSGCGWPSESIGRAAISAVDSHPGYTLIAGQPVSVDNFAEESRFTPSSLLQNLNMRSGISAIVYGTDRAYGVCSLAMPPKWVSLPQKTFPSFSQLLMR